MFKVILAFLIIQQVISIDDELLSVSKHPLFTKIVELVDQLLIQVRKMQTLITRTGNVLDPMPNNLRPLFAECFNATYNVSLIQYSSSLSEAETTRIPQIKAQLQQAITLTQQLNTIDKTERIISDINANIVKPSLTLMIKIHDCLKSKFQMNTV